MWERIAECGGGLNGWERKLADVVWLIEAENTFDLVVINVFLHFDNVGVKMLNVFDVWENECLGGVESKRNYVFDVVKTHLNSSLWSFKLHLWLVNVLLIVCDLDHEGHVESLLEVPCENEGNSVAHVESLSTGTSAGVEIERLLLFICI